MACKLPTFPQGGTPKASLSDGRCSPLGEDEAAGLPLEGGVALRDDVEVHDLVGHGAGLGPYLDGYGGWWRGGWGGCVDDGGGGGGLG